MVAVSLLWAALTLSANEPPDTIVIGPKPFVEALQPWLAWRAAQGHRFGFLSNEHSLTALRAAVRQSAQAGRLKFIVLVGDAEPGADADARLKARCVPTRLIASKVNVKFGSEPEIATDNWLADLDDDDVPDVAIGRLTADSPAELSRMVKKILDYERSNDHGAWRQRLNFIAGVGGFGPLVDTVVESTTKKFLTDCIPADYHTTMTYGSWRSPFCPDPRRFHETAVQRLNEGCLFWVYLGHGHNTALDHVHVPGGAFPIFSTKDVEKLAAQQRSPIAVFLACYTGAFDLPQDCLAEEMLRADGGPVAVLCGSRVTMPYGMSVLGTALLDECFRQKQRTLGEALLHAKRRAMADDPENLNRQMLDALAATLSPASSQLADERREHLALFNLLGDPLLRLRHPAAIELQSPGDVEAGAVIDVVGRSPIAGRCQIELVCRRDRLKETPPSRDRFQPTNVALAEYSEVYERANNTRWATHVVALPQAGEFRTQLRVPPEANGPCHLKLFTEGREQCASGAVNVFVRRPENGR